MRLENSELRTFQAVIENNGFNRAAQRLHISQSAVSQAISNLEAKLDQPLIKRGKQLGLTDAGRRLWEYANEVLREEQQVLEDIARIKRGDQQILNLAINATINRFYAPQLLSQFCQMQPDTLLKVAELPSRDLIYDIVSGRAELAMGPFQKHMEAFATIPLFQETRYLVVSPNHPHYEKMISGDAKSLRQSPLITSSLDNPQMRPAIQRIRDRFKSVWEISSLSMRIHLVNQGLGAAFIDSKLLEDHPVCRQFKIMQELPYGTIERQVGIYYKSGKTLNDSAKQFIELCLSFWESEPQSS
jgi:LysR family transcriptional regulator, benzoate and cis,cis-muconate-responsive activator of ben and cat genes